MEDPVGSRTTFFCDGCNEDQEALTGLTLELQAHHPQGSPTFMRKRAKGFCKKCYGPKLVAICEAIDTILGPEEKGDQPVRAA